MADVRYPYADNFLTSIWDSLGGDRKSIEDVTFAGDAVLPANFAMTDLGAASFAAAGAAIAELIEAVGAERPSVHVDRTRGTAWFRGASKQVGKWQPGPGGPFRDISTDYDTADGRFIRFQANYEHLRDAILNVLDVPEDKAAIAAVIAKHNADEIESAIVDGGGAASASRTTAEWLAHPQGSAVNAEPLIDVTTTSRVADRWRPTPERPLAGIRVLDVTRVLAGPMGTRFLAGYGAEVMRVDPPGYFEPGGSSGGDLTLGKRCAFLDLKTEAGTAQFLELLSGADVFVHGLRADAFERLGIDRSVIEATRPGLVEVTLNAYGWTGPWKNRRGFDTLVQLSSGMANAGMEWAKTEKPFRWSLSILDHATGYMIAAAAIRGLTHRIKTDEGSLSRLSLARTAGLIVAAGEPPEETPMEFPLDGPFEDRVFSTGRGPVRRLEWPVEIPGTPFFWERPGDPYGSSTAVWAGSSTAGRPPE